MEKATASSSRSLTLVDIINDDELSPRTLDELFDEMDRQNEEQEASQKTEKAQDKNSKQFAPRKCARVTASSLDIQPIQDKIQRLEKLLQVNFNTPESEEIAEQKRAVERISEELDKLISMVSSASNKTATSKNKRRRRHSSAREMFDSNQLEQLLKMWNETNTPSLEQRTELANELGCKVEKVDMYFKNKRYKIKRKK